MTEDMSVNLPATVVDSVDEVLTWAGLPEAGPLVERVSPANAAQTLGVPTPNDLGRAIRRDFDDAVNFEQDQSRR